MPHTHAPASSVQVDAGEAAERARTRPSPRCAQVVYRGKGYFFSWWNVLDGLAVAVAWPLCVLANLGGVRGLVTRIWGGGGGRWRVSADHLVVSSVAFLL
jgi:hypothetical protein